MTDAEGSRCTSETDMIIHVDCASHVYADGSVGLHEMCFFVRRGEVVVVCGANGSGKSTLIEHLNGGLVPEEGRIEVHGETVDERRRHELWKTVGVVFQDADSQLFAPTVLEDVAFGPLNLGLSPDEARKVACRALEAVDAVRLIEKIPAYMSGGEKRLAAIAGILAMQPEVIALDEPTSDLDPAHAARIESLVRELRERGEFGIVLSTHDLDLASRIADRVVILRDGSVIAEGLPRDVFYDRALLERSGLVEPCVVRIWRAVRGDGEGAMDPRPITEEELVEALKTGLNHRCRRDLEGGAD
ncbi:MAG TPA: ATP-binding cassette domain-containing protein [Methanoregulaceae archaeon]|nr:ATP-binding cassette domain-containing protein [Methanoregulaceae archaeon]HQJ88028.1 ATP-binding cassette domain-containing protein [Methanoregulaceae archaeon]